MEKCDYIIHLKVWILSTKALYLLVKSKLCHWINMLCKYVIYSGQNDMKVLLLQRFLIILYTWKSEFWAQKLSIYLLKGNCVIEFTCSVNILSILARMICQYSWYGEMWLYYTLESLNFEHKSLVYTCSVNM